MPEHIRSLIYIISLTIIFFSFANRIACSISEPLDFIRRRNLWFALTITAFLSQNFWVYAFIATSLLIVTNRRENNPAAIFFFLLFALPGSSIQIPGMGIINYLFELSHIRILELVILLPAYFALRRTRDNMTIGHSGPDKALAAYLTLTIVLYLLRESSITQALRLTFYLILETFLPYYVISRSLKNIQSFRDALLSLLLAIMILAPLALFESVKHWLLYSKLLDILNLNSGITQYLGRDGMLRAVVTSGQAIALGYLMAVGLGLYLYLQYFIQKKYIRNFGILLLTAGLIAPLSRGPWIGAALLLFVFVATGRNPIRHLISLALFAMLALSFISMLPGGEKVINLLPFVGSTEKENVDYRKDLLTNSMIVIKRNPWFGSYDYRETPEMEAMRQGQGIIDIVNTYISIALEKGWVGLIFFISFFTLTLWGIYRSMRSISNKDSEEYLLGRTLFSTLCAILLIISTVSSITVIPIVYWTMAGVGVAYVQMVRKNLDGINKQ